MRLRNGFLYLACLGLGGCIFGYYVPAPADSRGDFVLSSEGASLEPCDLGPGIWDANTPGTCIYVGSRKCSGCILLPAGTPIRVLHAYIGDGYQDVSIEVGIGTRRKVVHALRNWAHVRQSLVRP